jgi:hypothetical protein
MGGSSGGYGWSSKSGATTLKSQATAMSIKEMAAVIEAAKPGDKLQLIFRDETFDGDLVGRIYMILMIHGQQIDFGEGGMRTLKAVADYGRWENCRDYVITILDGFDPEYFIKRTLDREMLESVALV